jgi:hypothetical protein
MLNCAEACLLNWGWQLRCRDSPLAVGQLRSSRVLCIGGPGIFAPKLPRSQYRNCYRRHPKIRKRPDLVILTRFVNLATFARSAIHLTVILARRGSIDCKVEDMDSRCARVTKGKLHARSVGRRRRRGCCCIPSKLREGKRQYLSPMLVRHARYRDHKLIGEGLLYKRILKAGLDVFT